MLDSCGLARLAFFAAAFAGVILAWATPALAHGVSAVTVDGPFVLPGAAVTVHGQFLNGDLAVPAGPVTVALGDDGPVVGQQPLDLEGKWTLTFTLPTATALGTYALDATVADGGGTLIARTALIVGEPAPAAPAEPQTSPQPEAVTDDSLRLVPTRTPLVAPAEPPAPRVVADRTAPAARVPVPVIRASPPAPATQVVRDHPSLQSRRTIVPKGLAKPGARLQPLAAPTRHPSEPRPEQQRAWWMLAALLLVLLLGGGAAGWITASRRRPDDPYDPVEAELQEIIAEERAKEHLRVPVG